MAGKAKLARAFAKPMSGTRGEAMGMSVATGIGVGTTNNIVNKHYLNQGRQAYYRRKLGNGRVITVRNGNVR